MCSRIRLLPSSPKYNFDLSNASANSFHPAGDGGDHFSVDCGLKPGESYIISREYIFFAGSTFPLMNSASHA